MPPAQLLPSGFALPPVEYLVGVGVATAVVVVALLVLRPAVTEATVLALTPWMVVGAGLYALYQAGAFLEQFAPLFGSPTVYLTTFVVAGSVWGLATWIDRDLRFVTISLLVTGLGAMSAVLGLALAYAYLREVPLTVHWPAVGLAAAGVATALVWGGFDRLAPDAAATAGLAGPVVVFGHLLDAFTTAVGLRQLGFAEQTPLSRAVVDLGTDLYAAPVLGGGWLFVLVKAALALAVVALVADVVREAPPQGYLVLAGVAAVGLGPGAHNVILFSLSAVLGGSPA
jgi:uncharacterized membrane protein